MAIHSYYDPDALFGLTSSIIKGYQILLSQSGGNNNNNNEEEYDPLPFLALTSGNVIDAVFGLSNNPDGSKTFSQSNAVLVKELKAHFLSSYENSSEQRRIVNCYNQTFTLLLEYHKEVDDINICTRMCRRGKVRRKAEKEIGHLFWELENNE